MDESDDVMKHKQNDVKSGNVRESLNVIDTKIHQAFSSALSASIHKHFIFRGFA